MQRFILLILLGLLPLLSFANMANPMEYGDELTDPFVNRHVDILREQIKVAILDYRHADWEIVYEIHADSGGIQIPFLFLALDLKSNFQVFLDGEPVQLEKMPDNIDLSSPIWNSYHRQHFNVPEAVFEYHSDPASVHFPWDHVHGDLAYFEVDLDSGRHTFRILYQAESGIDRSDYIREYIYQYALAPARQWRSFNSLKIQLDNSAKKFALRTSLGQPQTGSLDGVAEWTFDGLPEDPTIEFSVQPGAGKWGEIAIGIGPFWLSWILFGLLAVPHLVLVYVRRKRNPNRKFGNWATAGLGIVIGFLAVIIFTYGDEIVQYSLNEHASNFGGYYAVFGFLFGCLLGAIYPFFAWVFDAVVKRLILRKS